MWKNHSWTSRFFQSFLQLCFWSILIVFFIFFWLFCESFWSWRLKSEGGGTIVLLLQGGGPIRRARSVIVNAGIKVQVGSRGISNVSPIWFHAPTHMLPSLRLIYYIYIFRDCFVGVDPPVFQPCTMEWNIFVQLYANMEYLKLL